MQQWRTEREVFARSGSDELIALSETHQQELQEALARLSEATVPYRVADVLTGYALGSLKNMGLPNVGTRSNPAFRLADLPFKAGHASPVKMLMASAILRAKVGGLRAAEKQPQEIGVSSTTHTPTLP